MPSKTSKKTAAKSKPEKATAAAGLPQDKLDSARIAQVFSWIVSGHSEQTVTEAIHGMWPDQESKPLVIAALEHLERAADFKPKVLRAWCLEAFRELHRRLIEMGDYVGAIRAVAKIEHFLDAAVERPGDPTTPTESENQIRGHLAPLFAHGDTLPLAELARLAAVKILNQRPE